MKRLVARLNAAKKSGRCENPTRELFQRLISVLSSKQLKVIWANSLSPMAIQSEAHSRTSTPELNAQRAQLASVRPETRMDYVRSQTADRRRVPRVLRELLSALTRRCNAKQRAEAEAAVHRVRSLKSEGKVYHVTSELYRCMERILTPEQVDAAWLDTQQRVQDYMANRASASATPQPEEALPPLPPQSPPLVALPTDADAPPARLTPSKRSADDIRSAAEELICLTEAATSRAKADAAADGDAAAAPSAKRARFE
mmetsp:Transcript_41606/g.130375  ORF Transcript_41606/g.130375 Transcript_41606/m.130375 type:complete len:257 (-) Transcript_41606:341-1111(-)